MYYCMNRETESLWSQLMGKAVSGAEAGKILEYLPTAYTTWAEWKIRHPETLVLSTQTGYNRDYGRTPYAGYEESASLMFPVNNHSGKLRKKERVIGIEVEGAYKAYPIKILKKGSPVKEDFFSGKILTIEYKKAAKSARITDLSGKELPAINLFWFAWYAFHPETAIYGIR